MPHLRYHPAPGFGDLLPGFAVVPQNPIRDASTGLVPSLQALSAYRITRRPHVGELMPAQFTVPQNPLVNALVNPLGSLQGCGGCAGCGGMGDLSISGVTTWLQAPSFISSIPNWMLYGGLGAAAFFFLGGTRRGRRSRVVATNPRRRHRRNE